MGDKKYYIQNGIVGNCILWWAKDDRGYTCEIEKAEQYTEEEADKRVRHKEKKWPIDLVQACIIQHVRMDFLTQMKNTKKDKEDE